MTEYLCRSLFLKRRYVLFVLHQKPQLIHAAQQAMPGERFEFEREAAAVRQFDITLRDIDRKFDARMLQQIAMLAFAEHNREQAVLQRVAAEDVGDLARQHGAEPEISQRPRRVFARGAAAEVAASDED